MDTEDTFASLVRRYRLQAGLTQEELAERAGLSANGLGALERGTRQRPHRTTVDLLVQALALSPPEAALLVATARGAERNDGSAAPPLPAGAVLGAAPATPLIGRAEELDRMGAILADVQGGRGRVLLLEGEAGVGKTRLLQELVAEAGARGFAVATAATDRSRSDGPYGLFRHVLRDLSRTVPSRARAEVERLFELVKRRMNGSEPCENDVAGEEVRDGIGRLVLAAAGFSPVALLLDDLDAADGDSVDSLHHLARRIHRAPVLIVCTLREVAGGAHPGLAAMLEALSRDRLIDVVTVRRLSHEETAAFVAATLDGSVSDEFVAFAHRRTKGNPRLLDSLVRSLGGRLQLEEEIGAGAMGRIFRAYDTVTHSKVAAKLMLARAGIGLDALLRFQQEGAVLRTMDHPNIVRIHDSFVEEHVSCIIMELLEGRSLGGILTDGPLDLPRAKTIALQVADALEYAHGHSIVHRDVKPDNIMFVEGEAKEVGGRIKVTDFGIARILPVDTKMSTIATTGMRVGTPLYMAPEQIEGKQVDARSDIYGFGAVLYHMVTGRPPFEGDDALAIAVQQMKDAPEPPSAIRPRLPREWDSVILKALRKEPRRRFHSVGEMKTAIEALGTKLAPKPYSPAPKRRIIGAVATAVVAAVAFAAYSASTSHATGATLSSYLSDLAAQGRLSGTVLVAKRGRVILDQGYGMANAASHVANRRRTEYALADATTTSLLTDSALQVTQRMKVAAWYPYPNFPFCPGLTVAFVHGCPSKWGKALTPAQTVRIETGGELPRSGFVTFADLIAGTSRLPNYSWGRAGNTIAQTEAACESLPLAPPRPVRVAYTSCANVVMSRIEANPPTGYIPSGRNTYENRAVLAKATSRPLAHQLLDAVTSPRLALDYDSAGNHSAHEYDDYYATYSTAPDLYRYDNLLFSDTYMAPEQTREAIDPRGIPAPADPGIRHVEWADGWKTGILFGARVAYTYGHLYNYQTANLRFPKAGITIIVMSNTAGTDALNAAEHAAAFALTGKQARLAATAPATATDLVGAYRRAVQSGDVAAIRASRARNAVDGLPLTASARTAARDITLSIGPGTLWLGAAQRYSATPNGGLLVFGPPAGAPLPGFCTDSTGLTPTGYFHWSILGNQLTIAKVTDRYCPYRARLLAGAWTRISAKPRPAPSPTTAPTPTKAPPLVVPRRAILTKLHGRGASFNNSVIHGAWGNPAGSFVAPSRFRVRLSYVCPKGSETLFIVGYPGGGTIHGPILADSFNPRHQPRFRLRAHVTKTVTSNAVRRWALSFSGQFACTWSFSARKL